MIEGARIVKNDKMHDSKQKMREKVGRLQENMLLCSAKQTKTTNMQHLSAYFYSYYYFTQTR